MNKYTAYYIRLSLDDNTDGESNSIVNQRQLIKEYIYSSDEFVESQTLEFVDDGYSGTNFNRPGIQQLLEAIKKGEIGCIIVKDFSRFGRNYLEVSKYIEQLFPYVGVRFIAINDAYDSKEHKGTTAEIDVPMRNMINEMYSKDISKKIKSAIQTKIKQGLISGPRIVFGYKRDNVHRNKIVIDEPAADVVRKIFQLTINGNTVFQIAERLNNEHILPPSAYRNKNGDKMKWHTTTVNEWQIIWKYHTIFTILSEERYTGTYIGGIRESVKLGSNELRIKPKEKWVRIPNNHPAIITQEQFDTISKMIHKYPDKKFNAKKNSHKPLYKKVKCGKCNQLLKYRGDTNIPFYMCRTARYTDEYGCMSGKIREKELYEAVTATLLTQINLFINNNQLLRMTKNKANKPNISTNNSILELNGEINKVQSDKRKLYEQYKNKEINQISYLQERETLEKELSNKITERETLSSQEQNHKNILESAERLSKEFLKYQSSDSKLELTKEIADKFIEVVNVYDPERIEVKFTFKDELERIFDFLYKS